MRPLAIVGNLVTSAVAAFIGVRYHLSPTLAALLLFGPLMSAMFIAMHKSSAGCASK